MFRFQLVRSKKIFTFYAVFHVSASDCTKLTLVIKKTKVNELLAQVGGMRFVSFSQSCIH